jgi:hypothetical protein
MEPVHELVDVLRGHDPLAVSLELEAPPNALERGIACTMCSCAVDPEQALSKLGKDLDAATIARIALCVQAIGLALNTHAGRLQRAWAGVRDQPGFRTGTTPVC